MEYKRVLITGGCGFVGRRFVKECSDMGCEVTVVDDLSTGISPKFWPHFVKPKNDIHFVKADVRNFFKKSNLSFDLIIHLSAVVGGRLTIEGDPLKVATDLAIDAMFFNWLPTLKPIPKKVLYFSSSAVYPIVYQTKKDSKRLSEDLVDFSDFIGVPDMTYGWSKLSGEFLAKHTVEKYGIEVVSFRPFSGYGEDQDLTYPFPSIVKRVINKESPIIIWGSGEQKRDFIHIDDVVKAVMIAKDKLKPGQCLNLGSGEETSFFELARLCMKFSGHDAEIKNDPSKPEGVFCRVCDSSRLFKFYRPQISLKEGIERTIHYLSRK